MKKIIVKKTPESKLIIERTNKFIVEWLEKEFPFKELEQDKQITFKECSGLVSTFAQTVYTYKKEMKGYELKESLRKLSLLCEAFTKEFYELINSEFIDRTIRAMILFVWDSVLKKYLNEALRLTDFLGVQVSVILLSEINIEIKKMGVN